ncbi:hypothetical protein PWT90_11268 [Aphanocladium album]|nr:hypothetical protein PWT90_11268 [Aphanocladium album]
MPVCPGDHLTEIRICRCRSDAVNHGRVVHADRDRLEVAVLLQGRFQSRERAVYFGVKYFSTSQLSGPPIQKLSVVEYSEAVSRRVLVCFGAVTEDYIARGSTGEPLLEFCYSLVFGEPLCRPFYLYVVREPLWDESWSLNLGGAGCGPQEPRAPESHSFCDDWFLIELDFSPRLPQPFADWMCFVQCSLADRDAFLDMSEEDTRWWDTGFFP